MSAMKTFGGGLCLAGGGFEEDGARLRLNRRRTPRYEVRGLAEAVIHRVDGSAALARVELVDSSATGLGVLSPIAAEVGEVLALHWDHQPIAGRTGVVARCEEIAREDGSRVYRLGLNSASVAAA